MVARPTSPDWLLVDRGVDGGSKGEPKNFFERMVTGRAGGSSSVRRHRHAPPFSPLPLAPCIALRSGAPLASRPTRTEPRPPPAATLISPQPFNGLATSLKVREAAAAPQRPPASPLAPPSAASAAPRPMTADARPSMPRSRR